MGWLGFLAGLGAGIMLNWVGDRLPGTTARLSGGRTPHRQLPRIAIWGLVATIARHPDRSELRTYYLDAAGEAGNALLFAYVWGRFGLSQTTFAMSCLCALFLLFARIDIKYRLVPNLLVFPAMVVVIIFAVLSSDLDWRRVALGGALGLAIFGLTACLQPGKLGWGDVKLATFIGMVFGFPDALWALALGIVAGGLAAIVLLLTSHGTSRTQIPYAPFLCLGALISLFFNPIGIL